MNNEIIAQLRNPVPCSTWDGEQDTVCGRDAHMLILISRDGIADGYGYKAQAICEKCTREMYSMYIPDDLITITAAQKILGYAGVSGVSNLISQGKLIGYMDPDEPNHTRARRVSRAAVEKLRGGAR